VNLQSLCEMAGSLFHPGTRGTPSSWLSRCRRVIGPLPGPPSKAFTYVTFEQSNLNAVPVLRPFIVFGTR